MKQIRTFAGLCAPVLLMALSPAHAALVSFTTGPKLSGDSTTAAFSGTIDLTSATASGGTLVITLKNESAAANGGYITAVAFNNPGPISPLTVSLLTTTGLTSVLGNAPIFINEVDAPPVAPFDIGAGVGNSWLSGGSPTGGIGVGQTGTLTFTFVGILTGLTTQSFVDTLNEPNGQWLALRFRGFEPDGSSKYGTTVKIPDPPPVPLPAAAWLLLSGLGGLGLLGRRRKAA